MLNEEDTSRFQKALEGPLRTFLHNKYESYMVSYFKFRERIGPQCPYCKSAARTIFASELKRNGDIFMSRWQSGDWNGYQ